LYDLSAWKVENAHKTNKLKKCLLIFKLIVIIYISTSAFWFKIKCIETSFNLKKTIWNLFSVFFVINNFCSLVGKTKLG